VASLCPFTCWRSRVMSRLCACCRSWTYALRGCSRALLAALEAVLAPGSYAAARGGHRLLTAVRGHLGEHARLAAYKVVSGLSLTAVLLVRPDLLVAWLRLDVYRFRLLLAREWHAHVSVGGRSRRCELYGGGCNGLAVPRCDELKRCLRPVWLQDHRRHVPILCVGGLDQVRR
jgi:hypothetical protein